MFTANLWRFVLLAGLSLSVCVGGEGPTKVCVAPFRGDVESDAARDVVFEVMLSAKGLSLSENCDSADLIIKGSVMSKTQQRSRAEGEATRHSSIGVVADGTGVAAAGLGVSGEERLASSETRSETTVTMRVTKRDGTVVWAGSWDSSGGKNRNALTDAAERVAKRFLRESLMPIGGGGLKPTAKPPAPRSQD